MRILKVSTCILAALATCELSHVANAASISKLSTKEPCTERASQQPCTAAKEHPYSSKASDLLAQATTFSDIQGNWAQTFIEALAARNIIQGFPDGSFRPNAPVTRAQFAALIQKAFQKQPVRTAVEFVDVPAYYWAYTPIQEAYEMGFLTGYPGNVFNPNLNIPRVQALVSLVNGINLSATATTPTVLNTYFQDASQIPDYARDSVAAATEKRIVVNYPNVAYLNPNEVATRADAAAFIYQALVSTGAVPPLDPSAIASQYVVGPQPTASTPSPTNTPKPPSSDRIQNLQSQLRDLQETRNFGNVFQGSPSITVANPFGFGADDYTVFVSGTYQESIRGSENDDGAVGVGIGLGDSRKLVGVELAYTFASVSSEASDFGRGGFNAKVHRQFIGDFAVAVGYNGFLNIQDNDFEDSGYGVVTKVFRTRDNVNLPFSRIAVSAGLGSGQFRPVEDIIAGDDSVNVFGSVAIRVGQPISFITEWTGQDLALGLSIVPIKNLNWVITPAVRDLAGDEDEARFVLGTGFSFKF